jgi:hypothetical protein
VLDYEMWRRELLNLGNLAETQNHSDQFLSFFPSQTGNPASWWITAVTSPL